MLKIPVLRKALKTSNFNSVLCKSFNGKNHATIIHAVNKIEKNINSDASLLEIINNIEELLK